MEIKDRDRLSFEATASRFGISKSSVRWAKRPEPCRTRNKPATKIDMERLARDVEAHPDAMHISRNVRSGSDAVSVGYTRLETAEDQPVKTSPHPKADDEARRLFKKKS